MSLLNLISGLIRNSTTKGGEYAGPCPFCGGNDRFRVWPEEGTSGRYWCRGCGKHGDSITLLRERDGLSYQDACDRLGIVPSLKWNLGPPVRRAGSAWAPREPSLPPESWQERAASFLAGCQKTLAGPSGDTARAFLSDRGLRSETVTAAGLGWNIADRYESREAWGLQPEMNEHGKPRRVWLPAGLFIPCFDKEGRIIRLRVRRPDPVDGPRYVMVPGSSSVPMTWGLDMKLLVLVESELDGLLLFQEAGDLAGVVALGSAQLRPDKVTHTAINQANLVLNCLDSDEAGAKEAWTWWKRTYKKIIRWPVPVGKDPTEAFQKGLNLRAWIMAGLPAVKLEER